LLSLFVCLHIDNITSFRIVSHSLGKGSSVRIWTQDAEMNITEQLVV